MKFLSTKPALIAGFVVLGVMLSVAFNTSVRTTQASVGRVGDLAGVVTNLESQKEGLEERLASLRGRLSELEEEAAEETGIRESFTDELEQVRALAGVTVLEGPGVEVRLEDAETIPLGQDPANSLVHDFDVAAMVNALFAAGAEGVSVNDERVVATTAIRCAGNTILVNSTRTGSPYVIQAVGEPDALEAGLLEDEATLLIVDAYPVQYGLRVTVDHVDDLELPEYHGSLRPEFADAVGVEAQ
jgi:uncharacterized protein YlxW (UPF0749 family)